jgi:hypothetical protein
MKIDNQKSRFGLREKAACSAALLTAGGAVACGICCALPAIALAGAGSILGWFARAQFWMTAIACLAVASAWGWIGLQGIRSKTRPARATLYPMIVATLILLLALLWPHIEPQILRRFAEG